VALPEPLHDGKAEQFAYLLVEPAPDAGDSDAGGAPPPSLAARLLPSGPAAAAHLRAAAPRLVFWDRFGGGGADGADGGWLAGYGFDSPEEAEAAVAGGGAARAALAWSLALPGRLLAVAAREPSEPMHSAVKARARARAGAGVGLSAGPRSAAGPPPVPGRAPLGAPGRRPGPSWLWRLRARRDTAAARQAC
jgi:hypothetical protein